MPKPVQFRLALASSFPTGTGSYGYKGSFQIIVENLAFEKQVAIWKQSGTTWSEIPAAYEESLPGNLESWTAPATNIAGAFVAKYTVGGVTYWDNNWGADYQFPQVADEFAAVTGADFKVVMGSASVTASQLKIMAGVQNIAYAKVVGAVFTTDDWATVQVALGSYSWTMKSGLEVWSITAPVSSPTQVKFALFYQVAGAEYWDNNFSQDYSVSPVSAPVARAVAPQISATAEYEAPDWAARPLQLPIPPPNKISPTPPDPRTPVH